MSSEDRERQKKEIKKAKITPPKKIASPSKDVAEGGLKKASQPKYCFTTAETDVYKDIIFTFASPLNFLASKTYNVYLIFLRDIPGNVCANNGLTGTGSNAQGTWAANTSNTLIYFQIGN